VKQPRFEQNIIHTYGEAGKAWLKRLDFTIKELQLYWNLKEIEAVPDLTYHFVAKTFTSNNSPVILKIGCASATVEAEAAALKHFDGHGSIQLFDRHTEHSALLLQQAIPGTSLKTLYPKQTDFVMECYIKAMNKIHQDKPLAHTPFSIEDWLQALDKEAANQIPFPLLSKARKIKKELLTSLDQRKFLHGDLHLNNILCHGEEWLCIDPQGVMGETAFEAAAFDFIADYEQELATTELFWDRLHLMAQKADLSFQRVKNWTFVRLILSAIWSIEDRGSPANALKLATILEGAA
jgi:streptomycin 6-kinase